MEMDLVQDVCNALEEFAPLAWQEDYDNCGLLVGNRQQPLTGVLLCIDVTTEVLYEARKKGCNMIVSHHPLIFGGLKSITGRTDVERCVEMALKWDIAIYAAHTNFDNAPNGVSWRMAEKLGLKSCRVLSEKAGYEGVGCGVVGELTTAMNEQEFFAMLKNVFGTPCIRHTECLGRKLKKVALCGGSGADFIEEAMAAQADVYVTADLKYHDFFRAENRLLLVDVGHFESEQFTKEIFFEQLKKKMPTFALHFSETTTNQVKYL